MNQPASVVTNRTAYRVIYGDTDKMGVVYYANYLRWFERGRSEFLRQLELPYASIELRNIHFPVIEVSCHYRRSARYDDLIMIETRLVSVTRATLTFHYQVLQDIDRSLLAEGSTKHACLNGQGQILRIPSDIGKALARAAAPAGDDHSRRTRQ